MSPKRKLIMSETQTTAAPTNKKAPVQRTIFDLDTFTEVTVLHDREAAPEIVSIDQALSLLGNDSKALFAIIQEGLDAEIGRKVGESVDGWYTKDDEGNAAPFAGTRADTDAVNSLVLTLCKTVFGWNKDLTLDQKKALKAQAMTMIQNTPAIKDGLKKSAALGK